MKVQIDKSYPLPCSAEIAWEFLQNIEAVAGCMPGAKITERIDAGRYKGTVTTKVGPVTMSFRGEVQMAEVDANARSLRLLGKGTDSTGSSGASMNLTARIEAAEGGLCTLGRRERIVDERQGGCLRRAHDEHGRRSDPAAVRRQLRDASQRAAGVSERRRRREAAARSHRGAPVAPAAGGRPRELNVLALAWAIFKDWLRGLFSKKTA